MVLAMQTQLKKHHQKGQKKKTQTKPTKTKPKLTAVCFFLYWMTYLAHS